MSQKNENVMAEEVQALTGDREMIRSRKSRWKFRLINRLFITYTKLLLKTCKFEIEGRDLFRDGIVFGFWHTDCYSMELLLSELSKTNSNVCAIVTANERGDYIENTLRHNGGTALRIPDGMEMRAAYKQMLEAVRRPELIMAVAFDGPSGPYHEVKKLAFMLARESDKPVVYAHFTYTHIIALKKRWDRYVIPLPFTRVKAHFEEIGKVDREKLKSFDEWKTEIKF